ncbi:hypothetical protein NDN08_008177 [Rhodosorus marinus]|uniref:FAD dependent oxidoreductase domain-containing protein n=1 Tax=Rhodosorus marinus TaxID=101924 RepID=A0AAV8V3X1_9RHOD|nr:hypothetical protein NDN08_008177 [Rhodosorus marinus]
MGFVGSGRGALPGVGVRRGGRWVCRLRNADVVVVGRGGIGLSTALEVAKNGGDVVVVGSFDTKSATWAAAGMLAPQAERLEEGPLLSLSLKSREMYPEYLEYLSAQSGEPVWLNDSGRFMSPLLNGEEGVLRSPPPARAGEALYFDCKGIHSVEPSLSDQVAGGWIYGNDASVDNRQLYSALQAACERAGVQFIEGKVTGLSMQKGRNAIEAARLQDGTLIRGDQFVLAAGAWSRDLLAIPVKPIKGQMLRLTPPAHKGRDAYALGSVLFGQSVYVVPRLDGSIVVGATVEDVGYREGVTALGISSLLMEAIKLVPGLAEYTIDETWFGYRPTTPDHMPILGKTRFSNATVATGHHRNGILLLPVTAKIMGNIIAGKPQADAELDGLLQSFSYERFTRKEVLNGARQGVPPGSVQPPKISVSIRQDSIAVPEQVSIPGFSAEEEEIKWKDSVMVWKVEKDGSEIPVRYKEDVSTFNRGFGHLSAASKTGRSEAGKTSQPIASIPAPTSVQEDEAPLSVNGSSNAYDDIMVHRDAAEDVFSANLLKNRTFGVKSTNLNSKGQPLCITDEELRAFNEAAEEGVKEFQRLRKAARDDRGDKHVEEYF